MTKRLFAILSIITGCFLPWAANAQSPWETGTYNKYAPEPDGYVPTPGLTPSQPSQQPAPENPGATQPAPKGTVSAAETPISPAGNKNQSSETKRRQAAANDSAFLTVAIQTGTGVLTTSEVASGKTQNQDVKSLAGKVVSAYKPIQLGLLDLAKTAKIATLKSAVVPNKETLKKLTDAKADSFDSLYLKAVQRDLSQLHYIFTKQAGTIHNADLKKYVVGKAAAVQKLDDQVKKLAESYPSPEKKAAQQSQQQTQQAQPRLPGTIPSFTGSTTR